VVESNIECVVVFIKYANILKLDYMCHNQMPFPILDPLKK